MDWVGFAIFTWVGFGIVLIFLLKRMRYLNNQIKLWEEELSEETQRANQAAFNLQVAEEIIKKYPQRDKRTGRFTKSPNKEFEELSSKF